MTSKAETQVVLLGFGRSPLASKLIAELRAKGVRARKIASADELASDSARERLTLLIDCRKGESEALEVLGYLRTRFTPVIASVLVRKPDFGQHYRLMDAGARGFFSMTEEPSFIARGVRLIAHA